MLVVLGCGRFQSSTSTLNTNQQIAPTPTPLPVKAVDLPAIFGKSVAEVKNMVNGKITYESADTINYELPQGNLSIDTRKSVNKMIMFHLADNASGSNYLISARTPQELANFVGINVSGKTPTSDNDTFLSYEDNFNGSPVEITVMKEYGEKLI